MDTIILDSFFQTLFKDAFGKTLFKNFLIEKSDTFFDGHFYKKKTLFGTHLIRHFYKDTF